MRTQNSNVWYNQSSHFSNTLEETKLDRIYHKTKLILQYSSDKYCSGGYIRVNVVAHRSLRQDDDVSLTSHNAERNSEGGCSTRRECLLPIISVWSE